MKLYIKHKLLSWKDKFFVKDENGEELYYVEGEMLSLGKKLHVYDMDGHEVAFIEQQISFLLPYYHAHIEGRGTATIRQKFSWFHPKYTLEGLDWEIKGSFWLHEYEICQGGQPVIYISKELMTWGDSYALNIANPKDALIALAVVLVIDCVNTSSI